jgi:hypothetical protein
VSSRVLQDSNHYSPGAVVGVREALSTLKKAIMSSPAGEGGGSAALADRNAVANSPKYRYPPRMSSQIQDPVVIRKFVTAL